MGLKDIIPLKIPTRSRGTFSAEPPIFYLISHLTEISTPVSSFPPFVGI
jgi:hypothetical protein